MKVWKKNLVAAAVLVTVCAGIYVNWLYTEQSAAVSLVDTLDTEKVMSEDLVLSEDLAALAAGEDVQTTASDYFAAVRLSRQQARDSAVNLLQEAMAYNDETGVKEAESAMELEEIVRAAAACGVTLGFTTQVANAAGPVAAIYFLAMKLPKEKYMGCSAWFFLIINWTKLPIFLWEGRITMEALKIDLVMIPFLLIGAALGILLLSKMPQKLFENIIQVLVVATAIKLFF